MDEPVPALVAPGSNPHTLGWAQRAGSCDGYIFVTPEYNGGASASLRNAIDYPYQEWARKAVAYVGYGVFGAVTAVQELRAQAGRLQMADIRPQVALSLREDSAGNTEFRPQRLHIEEVHKLVDELLAWNTALAPLRAVAGACRVNSRKPGVRLAAVPASRSAMPTRAGPDRAAGESTRRTTRAAYTALGWVVVFFAFHVYWYLGGSFETPASYPADHTRWSPGSSTYSSCRLPAGSVCVLGDLLDRGGAQAGDPRHAHHLAQGIDPRRGDHAPVPTMIICLRANVPRTASTASGKVWGSPVFPVNTRTATGRPSGSVSSPYSICALPRLPSREYP